VDAWRIFELAGGKAVRCGLCEEMAAVGNWMERCGVLLKAVGHVFLLLNLAFTSLFWMAETT